MGILRSVLYWWKSTRGLPGTDAAERGLPTKARSRQVAGAAVAHETSGSLADTGSAIGSTNRDAAAWIARTRELERSSRIREARVALQAASAAPGLGELPDRDTAYFSLRSGRLVEAIAALRRCVGADSNARDVRMDLARALASTGDVAGALDQWRMLVERPDATATEAFGHAELLLRTGRVEDARAAVQAGIAAHPSSAALHALCGAILHVLGHGEASLRSYEIAAGIAAAEGDPSEIFVEYAIALCGANRLREGAELLASRLPEVPSVRGHQQLATAALTLGDFEIGWPQLEYRWLEGPVAAVRPTHALPPWRGQDLRSRTLLVRAEQGIGDAIQFSRYLPLLKARGARTLFLPLAGMEAYSSRFAGIDRCVDVDVDLRGVDYYVDLMTIPGIVGTTASDVPPIAPLRPASDDVRARWAARMRDLPHPRVGLVWAGRPEHARDRERSIPLARFAPLLELPGVQWVSLQKGAAASQAADFASSARFVNLADELATLDDAAEAVGHLDLVICVDTAIAHLAGSLGKPVWMLVPQPADSRWLEAGRRTAWYPSMTLFRQDRPGDWDGPLDRLRNGVESLARTGVLPDVVSERTTAVSPPSSWSPLPRTLLAEVIDTRHGLMQFLPDAGDEARALRCCGEWRSRELQVASGLARRGDWWIDAGASWGTHAIPLARALGPEGELLAWEDRHARRRMLRNNVRYHRLDQVTILTTSSGMSIDDLGLERLDGLKVSAPLSASSLINGALQTLRRCRPSLVIAADEEDMLRNSASALRDQGYRIYRLESRLFTTPNFFRSSADVFDGRMAVTLVAVPEEKPGIVPPPDSVEWRN